MKVESEQGGATLTGLQRFTDEPLTETRKNGNVEFQPFQRFTDEQLAAEMRRRGFEVWKWKELGELGIDYWIW